MGWGVCYKDVRLGTKESDVEQGAERMTETTRGMSGQTEAVSSSRLGRT